MKRRTLTAAVVVAAVALAAAAPSFLLAQPAAPKTKAGSYKIDPVHSYVLFNIKHANIGTSWGRVNDPSGTITVDDNGTPTLDVTLELAKIDTANAQRDKHLKGPDFFNAGQYPTMTFKSTAANLSPDGTSYAVTGDLTIKGQTKPITVTLKKVGEADGGAQMGYRVGYDTTFTVNRMDFGVDYGKGMLSDDVNVMISLEGVRQ